MSYKILYILVMAVLLGASWTTLAANATFGGQAAEQFRVFEQSGGFIGFLSRWLFPVMIASAAVVATLSIIFAGFQWMAGAVSPPQVEAAKSRIGASVLGLAIALTSWILLNTINPSFVNLRAPVGFTLNCDGPCPNWNEILFGTNSNLSPEQSWEEAKKQVAGDLKTRNPNLTEEEATRQAQNIADVNCKANPGLYTGRNYPQCHSVLQGVCREENNGRTFCSDERFKYNPQR